jgi:hypothetical protein
MLGATSLRLREAPALVARSHLLGCRVHHCRDALHRVMPLHCRLQLSEEVRRPDRLGEVERLAQIVVGRPLKIAHDS